LTDIQRISVFSLLRRLESVNAATPATRILPETVNNFLTFNFELRSATVVDRAAKFVSEFPVRCSNLLHCA